MRLHEYAFQGGAAESIDPPLEPTDNYGRQEWLEEKEEDTDDSSRCSSRETDSRE